ncbi:hypothetical protein ACPWSR_09970 [Alloiococcus sp. CFN-8]|uniref:hypothetical protein n=1 Tax=Alloiococcus sp. CFN-8 TaxID=3416081 RepID=UPI003CF59CE4
MRNYDKSARDNETQEKGYIDGLLEDLTSSRLQRAFVLSEVLNKPVAKREKSRRNYLRRKP